MTRTDEQTDDAASTAELVPDVLATKSDDVPPATVAATSTTDSTVENRVTIVAHDRPASFEVTVDGEIDDLEADGTTTVSGSTVEGTVADGTVRFRFTGDLTDVTFVDREITGRSPAAAPNVHLDYGAPE